MALLSVMRVLLCGYMFFSLCHPMPDASVVPKTATCHPCILSHVALCQVDTNICVFAWKPLPAVSLHSRTLAPSKEFVRCWSPRSPLRMAANSSVICNS